MLKENQSVEEQFKKIALYQVSYPCNLLEVYYIQNSLLLCQRNRFLYGNASFAPDFRTQ